MASLRKSLRNGWHLATIEHRTNLDPVSEGSLRHRSLVRWVEKHKTGKVKSRIKNLRGFYLHSIFAFENETDASYFTLRWK
jgi:hypothetical protein